MQANSFTPPLQLHPCAAGGAESQLWYFGKNGSIFTLDRAGTTGYCITTSGKGGGWDPSSSESGQLVNCSSPGVQFRVAPFAFPPDTAVAQNLQPLALALPLTTPTVCKTDGDTTACYITKGGGPCGSNVCPGPKALPIAVEMPQGLQPSLELCAQICYSRNLSKAG
eukprot:gene16925-25899_t